MTTFDIIITLSKIYDTCVFRFVITPSDDFQPVFTSIQDTITPSQGDYIFNKLARGLRATPNETISDGVKIVSAFQTCEAYTYKEILSNLNYTL